MEREHYDFKNCAHSVDFTNPKYVLLNEIGMDCKLKYLGLNGNQLNELPKTILAECPHLLHLNLGYNQISQLDHFAHLRFQKEKLKTLSILVLRNNPIRSLAFRVENSDSNIVDENAPSGEFSGVRSVTNVFTEKLFPNLYELSLSFCELRGELPSFPLPQLTNLEVSMGLKSATKLDADMFRSLKNLEWLALDHNSLREIQ